RREVHDVADDPVLDAAVEAHHAERGETDGDALTDVEIVAPPSPLGNELAHGGAELDGGVDGARRRIGTRQWVPEEEHHAVAGEVADGGPVATDERTDRVVELAEH